MDPERWARVESVCFDALTRSPAERAAFVRAACADDSDLRRAVLALVDQHQRDPSFLDRPLVDLAGLGPGAPGGAILPDAIGPYRVIRRLGEGGMGEVYLAVQRVEDVRRLVAVKVIRRDRDTEEVLRRFRLERRILAGLDHPHIARLLDAGATEGGGPYFVMEYVSGVPVDAFCETRALPLDRRLELFLTICGAVQHAHQNLVVHRDLKPGNILVAGDGSPKLLDFGIGKVLGESEAFGTAVETRTDVRPLTPAYAAPEQIRREPVTTATDVYALGVLLYELLARRHPYVTGGESVRDIERAVLETDPVPPSAAARPPELRRRLSGDLDNIVLKTLRKEPARRYASAAALADDLRRHLHGLPVSARADTVGYRARKFVRRNAAWVAAAAVAFFALGATTVVTLVQSRRVTLESERVTRERDKALEVRGFLMEMFGATGADHAIGDSVTARQLLDLQAARMDVAYPDRPGLRADMLEILADGYDRLGLYAPAESLARRALDLRRGTEGVPPSDVASSLTLLGWIVHERGRSVEAEPLLREAVALRRAAGPRFAVDLSRSLNDLGVVLTAQRRYAEADTGLAEALAIRRSALGGGHRSVGITASNLAAALFYQSKVDQAIRVQQVAVRALLQAVGPDHQRTVIALGNLAAFRQTVGDWEGAEREYRTLLGRQMRVQGREHPMTAQFMVYLARTLLRQASGPADSALVEAEGLLRNALGLQEAWLGPAHPQVGSTLQDLSSVVAARGDRRAALAVQEEAVEVYRQAHGEGSAEAKAARARLAKLRQ